MAAVLLWKPSANRLQPATPIILSVLIVVSNFMFVSKFVRTLDPHPLFDRNPIAQVYARIDCIARTDLVGANPIAYQLGYHRIPATSSRHGKELRWFLDLAGGAMASDNPSPRFANIAGTRYFIATAKLSVSPSARGPIPLDTLLRTPGSFLLQNRNCFPRAFLASKYQVINDLAAIRQEVHHGSSDLRRVVLLETAPLVELGAVPDSNDRSVITYYGLDSVDIAVSCSTAQLLVLTDNYYDAWHAYVDGSETIIYRAYSSFRSVVVPAGQHHVAFRYDSPQLRWGAWLTLAGLLVASGVLISELRPGRRTRQSMEAKV